MDDCIEFKGCKDKDGYGKKWLRGKVYLAHRLAYCKAKNIDIREIDGLIVMHTCDNPPCVNPEHLKLGTPKDNMSDRDNKNRQAKGENHGIAKLTDGDIYCIKKLNNRLSQRCIASIYKISQPQVSKIVNSISWKHIDGVKK